MDKTSSSPSTPRCFLATLHYNVDAGGKLMTRTTTPTTLDFLPRVENTVRQDHPFPHVYLEGLFAPEFYLRLLSNLPPTEAYRELPHRDAMQPDGRSARRKFYLFPEHIRLLSPGPREVLSE